MFLTLSLSSVVKANSPCVQSNVLGYFNGVDTTESQAQMALTALHHIHGPTAADGKPVKYRLLYNSTNGLSDFAEVFDQRLQEQNGLLQDRFELFFSALNGDGEWWTNIIDALPEVLPLLDDFVETIAAERTSKMTDLLASPPTLEDYEQHKEQIEQWMVSGNRILFVGHSQGNLFLNQAYDFAKSDIGEDSVKAVHIAPASPILNGEHTLANLDIVIDALRLTGGFVPAVTNSIPAYTNRPPGLNGKRDLLGHGILEIYLNPSLSISSRIETHIDDAINSLRKSKYFSYSGTVIVFDEVWTYRCNPDGSWYAFP